MYDPPDLTGYIYSLNPLSCLYSKDCNHIFMAIMMSRIFLPNFFNKPGIIAHIILFRGIPFWVAVFLLWFSKEVELSIISHVLSFEVELFTDMSRNWQPIQITRLDFYSPRT